MQNNPLITVIIPLYNKEKSILITVNSVLKQKIDDFEILVIDDGSSDKSVEVIEQLNDERITIISKRNGGVSSARNYGIRKAKGEFLFFLDADDEILENSFTVFNELIKKYSHEKIFTTNFLYSEDDNIYEYCKRKSTGIVKNPFKEILQIKIFLRMGNLLIHRDLVFNKCLFNEEICKSEDFDFIFRLIHAKNLVYSPLPTMIYKRDNSELSKKNTDYHNDFISIVKIEGSFYKRILCSNYVLNYHNGLFSSLFNFYFNTKAEPLYLIIHYCIIKLFKISSKFKSLF